MGGSRKKRPISWKQACLPIVDGGLGLKASKEMNIALLGKQIDKILQYDKPESFWKKTIQSKYGDIKTALDSTDNTASWSWQELRRTYQRLKQFTTWIVGKESKVQIWHDSWIEEIPLIRIPWIRNEDMVNNDTIGELMNDDRWNIEKCEATLPHNYLKKTIGARIEDKDQIIWRDCKQGTYNVATTYQHLVKGNIETNGRVFIPKLRNAPEEYGGFCGR